LTCDIRLSGEMRVTVPSVVRADQGDR